MQQRVQRLAMGSTLLLLTLLALLEAPSCVSAAEAEEPAAKSAPSVDEDVDLDLDGPDDEDLDFDADDAVEGEAKPPVEDFDKDMPEAEQKTRMRACFAHSMKRVQSSQEKIQETVKQMLEMPKMTREQAVNTIVFSWMMSCYINIGEEGVTAAGDGQELSQEEEAAVFAQGGGKQNLNEVSRRQWQLLESVIMEQQEKNPPPKQQSTQSSQSSSYQRTPGGQEAPQQPPKVPPSQFGITYVLLIFVVIFGIIGLAVRYLMQNTQGGSGYAKERSAKSARRAEKQEKKLAKKVS